MLLMACTLFYKSDYLDGGPGCGAALTFPLPGRSARAVHLPAL